VPALTTVDPPLNGLALELRHNFSDRAGNQPNALYSSQAAQLFTTCFQISLVSQAFDLG
jgi:hypothetical protein